MLHTSVTAGVYEGNELAAYHGLLKSLIMKMVYSSHGRGVVTGCDGWKNPINGSVQKSHLWFHLGSAYLHISKAIWYGMPNLT